MYFKTLMLILAKIRVVYNMNLSFTDIHNDDDNASYFGYPETPTAIIPFLYQAEPFGPEGNQQRDKHLRRWTRPVVEVQTPTAVLLSFPTICHR